MDDSKYLDLEAYERAKEPHKREKAYYWATAIGLQKVDGLETSDYLKQTARRNIEGEIGIEEAKNLLRSYYQSKVGHEGDRDDQHEGIDYDYSFLQRFFRNLLLGEKNELKNRYMLVDLPAEWKDKS